MDGWWDGGMDGWWDGGMDVRQVLSSCRQVEGNPRGLAGAVQGVQEQRAGPHVKSRFFGCLCCDSEGLGQGGRPSPAEVWEGQGGWWEPWGTCRLTQRLCFNKSHPCPVAGSRLLAGAER